MATDLTFLSAGLRDEIGSDRRKTGRIDMVLRCATDAGHGRAIVIKDEAQAMRLIEEIARMVNNRRDIERARAERAK
jgi:hypothetical protein